MHRYPPPAFDENDTKGEQNRVDIVLLENGVPKEVIGAQDDTSYSHYSEIATIEANWNLRTFGRYDVGANVFRFVAERIGDDICSLNSLCPGVFDTRHKALCLFPTRHWC